VEELLKTDSRSRDYWSNLLSIDLNNEELRYTREELALHILTAMVNFRLPSQEIPIPNMAGALQVLRKMPPKVFVDRARLMEERAKGSIGSIIVCISFAVVN
jgi:hypothetical protein